MKKICLLFVSFLFLTAFMHAQEKKAQEVKYYPQLKINEEWISQRLQQAKISGADESELFQLKEHYHQLYKKQKENELAGIDMRQAVPPPQILTACVNPGFEDGTINGWLLEVGDNSISTLPCPTCFTGPGGVYQVLSPGGTSNVNTLACSCSAIDCSTQPSTNGIDGFGGFSTTAPAPLGGNCLLMNNSTCNYKMERASQTFIVDNTNNAFTFGYAAVLQSGGHATNAQPYFHVDVTDNTTGSVIPCTQYDAVAPTSGNLNGWSVSSVDAAVYTKPWTIVTLDLSSVITHTVTISFTVSDCNAGGHFGYCYIDAQCNPNQITAVKQLCAGGGAAILAGPPGMASYSWTGPVTGNTQNLTTSSPGAYTLTTTNVTGCPAPVLTYTLLMNPVPTVSFTTSGAACSTNELFVDASTISSGSIASWNWNFGNGNTAVSNTVGNSQNVGYSPGTYTVTLTDTSAAGCVGTYSNVITIPPGVSDAFTASTVCVGATTNFTNSSSGGSSYIWDFGDGSATVTTATPTNQTHTYGSGGSYVATLSVTTTGTCVATTTVNVTVNNKPTITATGNSICNGAGPVNISGGGGSTYTWSANAGSATTQTVSVNPSGPTDYTVTSTDANGCVNTATCTVIVIPNPTVSVANTSICPGQTATLTANSNTTNFSWTGNNITSATTGSVITANPAATSTYTVIASAGSCTVSTTAQITINPSIVPTYSVSTVCEGQPSLFTNTTVGVSTYTWTFGDGGTNTTNLSPSNTYSAAGSYVSTFSVVNSQGCSGISTLTVTVNGNPSPSFTSSTPCQGTAVNFTNNTPATPTITSYTWNFGDGTGSAAPSPTNNYAAAGVYSTVLTATATGGCVGTFTAPVTVHPNPVANFSSTTVCLNTAPTAFTDQSTLTNPTGINDNITTWSWAFGDGNTSVTQSPTNGYTTCGSFTATLTVTTNNLCTNTVSSPVTVNCIPVLTAPVSLTVCPNSPVAPAAYTVTIAGSTIAWNAATTVTGITPGSGSGNVPNYTSMTPNLTGANISDVISAVPTSTAGCVGLPQTFTVVVKPTPLMNTMPDITVCEQQTVNVPVFSSTPSGSTFAWNNSNTTVGLGASGSGNIPSFTGLTGGSPSAVIATVSVTPTLNGCVGPDSVFVITVSPQPTVTLTSPPLTCPGNVVPAAAYTMNPNDPNTTFTWTNSNGATGMPLNSGGTVTTPGYSFTASPNATLANVAGTVTVIPTLGACVGPPATYTVTIYPTPVLNAIPDVEYCPGATTAPVNISMIPATGGVQSYNWSSPTGNNIGMPGTPPITGNTNIVPSFTTTNAGSTATSAQVIVSGGLNGCPALPISFNITVNPNPTAAFSNSTGVCLGSPMSFTDGSTVGTGNVAQWGWDFNGDGIYTDALTQNAQYVFPSPAGSHTVGLFVTTNKGCTASVTKPVYINYIPVPQFAGDVLVGCPDHPVNYTQSSSVTGPAQINYWYWNFGNGTTYTATASGSNPPTVVYTNLSPTQSAFYTVSLTVATDSGCSASLTNTNYITVYPHPLPGFTWGPTDPPADIENPTVYFIDESQGAAGPNSYGPVGMLWYLGDVFLMNQGANYINTTQNPIHTYEHYDPYTYYVTQWVQNTYGCKDSITKPVDIKPGYTFYIPNAFSPNGDGINEGFKGTGVGIDNDTYNLWVFDRWGMMIFYTNDMEKVWDGRIQGKGGDIVQEDVYVWKVKFSDFLGRKHEYKGTVSVIK